MKNGEQAVKKSNTQIASETLTEILDLGTRDFVLCAGARNAPLVLPLLKTDDLTLFHHFDERAAAFFALGLAKRRLQPVCVVTTSGTAVAELLPAVIEAHYSGIPIILLTADRPERFRGTGAPQAIEQVGIFGNYACQKTENWNHQTPLHLNVSFEEPLFENGARELRPLDAALEQGPKKSGIPFQLLEKKSVALIGELLQTERDTVSHFLRQTQIPAWCEAHSGLREADGINHIRGGDAAFKNADIEQVIRFGGVPSLRFWRDLENLPEIDVLTFSRTQFSGLARKSGNFHFHEPTGLVHEATGSVREPTLLDRESLASTKVEVTADAPPRNFDFSRSLSREEQAIHDLSKKIPPEALIFLGNSLPIREWNVAATTDIAHPHCFANRGANGIDGEISTFLGLCQDFEGDECWGIFGDLTTLYDLNAPWIADQISPEKKIHIVVIDNGGGKIFSKLPGLKDLPDTEKRVTENWHDFNFEKWASLWPRIDVEILDVR